MKAINTRHIINAGVSHRFPTCKGKPYTVEGCLIMLCDNGHADILVNSNKFRLSKGRMLFASFEMLMVPLGNSDDFSARFLKLDFLSTQNLYYLVTSQSFWNFIYTTPVFPLPENLRNIAESWFNVLLWMETNCQGLLREKALYNEACNFITIMAQQVEYQSGNKVLAIDKSRAWTIANDFIALLNRHYAEHHDVAYYAGRLNISSNYLNIIIKRYIGTTAKEQISKMLILTAKTLIDTTDLSLKQIADRLHFKDTSYLCRLFKLHTGMTPMNYRNAKAEVYETDEKNQPADNNFEGL